MVNEPGHVYEVGAIEGCPGDRALLLGAGRTVNLSFSPHTGEDATVCLEMEASPGEGGVELLRMFRAKASGYEFGLRFGSSAPRGRRLVLLLDSIGAFYTVSDGLPPSRLFHVCSQWSRGADGSREGIIVRNADISMLGRHQSRSPESLASASTPLERWTLGGLPSTPESPLVRVSSITTWDRVLTREELQSVYGNSKGDCGMRLRKEL
jgi:hypothetical protein